MPIGARPTPAQLAARPRPRSPRAQESVDAKVQDMFKDEDDKNVQFHKFIELQRASSKELIRKTPSNVPSVRGLSYSKDPSKVLHVPF